MLKYEKDALFKGQAEQTECKKCTLKIWDKSHRCEKYYFTHLTV